MAAPTNLGLREITFADGSEALGATVFYTVGRRQFWENIPGSSLDDVEENFRSLANFRTNLQSVGCLPASMARVPTCELDGCTANLMDADDGGLYCDDGHPQNMPSAR